MQDPGKEPPRDAGDPYSRVEYRRLIAWPERIRREAPLLERWSFGLPARSILDLGCGTGEHSRYFAEQGFRVVGLDFSPGMLAQARCAPDSSDLDYIRADMTRLPFAREQFGGVLCLGNSLVHLIDQPALEAFFLGVGRVLRPGGGLLLQILNYQRLFEKGIRWLPLNFSPDPQGELVFLRLMQFLPDRQVQFCPTTLRFDPSREVPVQVIQSRRVQLRGWLKPDLESAARVAGLEFVAVWGNMTSGEFQSQESTDLVIQAVRSTG